VNAEFVRQPMTQSGSRKAALGQDIATTNRKNVAELPNAKIVPPRHRRNAGKTLCHA
jgi:hypothetical protein